VICCRKKNTGRSQKAQRVIISVPAVETELHPEDRFCGIGVSKVRHRDFVKCRNICWIFSEYCQLITSIKSNLKVIY